MSMVVTIISPSAQNLETALFIPHPSHNEACRNGNFIRKKAKVERVKSFLVFSKLYKNFQSNSVPRVAGFITSGNTIHKYVDLSLANIMPTLS